MLYSEGDSFNSALMRNEGFRQKLRQDMLDRTKRNPSYSMRAFARTLDLDAATLSQLLSGKRALTDKMCLRLSGRLNLSPEETQTLMKDESYQLVKNDQFEVISDWFHFAILELTYLPHFKPSVKWIAKVLGITQHETKDAVERLFRLGLLKKSNATWVDTMGDGGNLGNSVPGIAYTNYQRQLLKKANLAMDQFPYDQRVQTSSTFPVSKTLIPKLKDYFLKCIKETKKQAAEAGDYDEVYQLTLSLFPVSETTRGKTND